MWLRRSTSGYSVKVTSNQVTTKSAAYTRQTLYGRDYLNRVLIITLVTGYWLLIIARPGKRRVTRGNRLDKLAFTVDPKYLVVCCFDVVTTVFLGFWYAARCLSNVHAATRNARNTIRGGECVRRATALAGRLLTMARNPFTYENSNDDQSSEFGFGRGMFPNPNIDYSLGGAKSLIPIADPDSDTQLLELAMIKRTDVADPLDVPSPFVAGNTDRYGAAPPLVRERKLPPHPPRPRYARTHMERQW